MEKIKNIKCEIDSENDDWCDIDHDTLPLGVKYERKNIEYIFKTSELNTEQIWNEELKATTTIEIPILATSTYNFVGRDLGASVQLNLKAIQELYDLTLQQQAEIEALKMRIDKVDSLGTAPVIVDKNGNLLSPPLWAGFGVILTGLVSAWLIRKNNNS